MIKSIFPVLFLAFAPVNAFAALGGGLDSVARDSEALGASRAVTAFAAYDLHESRSADGLRLRQYVDHAGRVFAVSWEGPRSPDVEQLLGEHAARYRAALAARFINHHVATVDEPGLAVTVMRLPRGWAGAALLPRALPSGVSRADIR